MTVVTIDMDGAVILNVCVFVEWRLLCQNNKV